MTPQKGNILSKHLCLMLMEWILIQVNSNPKVIMEIYLKPRRDANFSLSKLQRWQRIAKLANFAVIGLMVTPNKFVKGKQIKRFRRRKIFRDI